LKFRLLDFEVENTRLAQRQHVNAKFEIQSVKQIQIFKEQKILNGPVLNFGLFRFRHSDFASLDARRDEF